MEPVSESLAQPGPAVDPPWVLVTGAARRLGRAVSLHFAHAGWNVLAHYRRSAAAADRLRSEVEQLGRRCQLVQADLVRPDAAVAVLDAAAGQPLPRCIVNNASLFATDDALSAHAAQLQKHLSTNTVTPLLLANELARRLPVDVAAGQHSVVHVLDQKVHNLNPDYFSYTVSKLALAGSVALQAQALAPRVRVCGLSPGLMFRSGPQSQANFDRASRVNLLQRAIDPDDVARCALFIAQNSSLNGTIIQADNGQHLLPLRRDVMFAVDSAPEVRP